MKRIVSLAAASVAGLLLSLSASAGGFLIKAGVSNSNMDLNRDVATVISDVFSASTFKNFTNFNVGVGYRTNSWNGFKLQPELLYNVRGTRIDNVTNWKMSYLELPVNVQWGIDLIVLRPFLQVAPFIGYDFQNVTSDTAAGNTLDDHNVTTGANRFEYGVSVGGGLDLLDRIQLSVTYNWNFGAVANLEAYKDQIAGIDRLNARCLQISMAYMF
ncbi:MAG: PorT family protein [Bacteroidales bacterium]|nr:PorT family protein [Bacteroidales bacterium]